MCVVGEADNLTRPQIANPLGRRVGRRENQRLDVRVRPLPVGPDLAGQPERQLRLDTTDNRAHLAP